MLNQLQTEYATLDRRVAALERPMDLTQLHADYIRLDQRLSVLERPIERKIVGGWRLRNSFSYASFAIDFASMRCIMRGHQQRDNALEFKLPQMSLGAASANWTQLLPVKEHRFWPQQKDLYANGICFWRGKFWVSPRKFYDTSPPQSLTLFAEDGEQISVNLPRQQFSGFVKRGPGLEPILGCGGYESGQGSAAGPTLATMDGRRLIVSHFLDDWSNREARDPDYSLGGQPDSFVGYTPRMINGKLEGRWCTDWIHGGGLVLPEGICYWPYLGTGSMNYNWQTRCFSQSWKSQQYIYDPVTYKLKARKPSPVFRVGGQEIGPDGTVYLGVESDETDALIVALR